MSYVTNDLVVLCAVHVGLKRFRKLIMLANTHSDQMVPYRTAAASATDPYDG